MPPWKTWKEWNKAQAHKQCVYKYTDFIIGSFNSLAGTAIPKTGIVLPIGIPFFPQLIAGPIVKYHDVAAQIDSRRQDVEDAAEGLVRFITDSRWDN